MSKIIENYQNNFKDIIHDFINFWYNGARFKFKPHVGFVHHKYISKNLNINLSGFRSTEEFSNKLKSKKKIFFIGSSALVGVPNLSDNETLTSIIEKKLKERDKNYDVFNFGLISSRIYSEFDLTLNLLNKYNPETVVFFTGYNDLHGSYHGLDFGNYTDINNLMSYGFEHNKNKAKLMYGLETFIEVFINFLKKPNFFGKNNVLKQTNKLRENRRKSLKQQEQTDTYELNKKLFLDTVELLFYHLQKLKIKIIFVYQTSLITTQKDLSDYEKEFYKFNADIGLYKNSNKSKDREIMSDYRNQTLSDLKKLANKFNIGFIDHEELVADKENSQKTIFFDNIHLTKFGTQQLSNYILKKI